MTWCWTSTSHCLNRCWPRCLKPHGATRPQWVNTLRTKQNGCHFPDDIFKCISLNENEWIWIKIPLKFVPKGPVNNISTLVQRMAWRRPGNKPFSEPRIISLPTHICVTRPQWVKGIKHSNWHLWCCDCLGNGFSFGLWFLPLVHSCFYHIEAK